MTVAVPHSRLNINLDHRTLLPAPIGDLYLEIRQTVDEVEAARCSSVIVDPHYSHFCTCPSCTLPMGQ